MNKLSYEAFETTKDAFEVYREMIKRNSMLDRQEKEFELNKIDRAEEEIKAIGTQL